MWIENAGRDVRYAARALRKSPGFTVAIVMTLALGIGANTAMFTVVDGVLLKPLGYSEPGRIVALQTRWTDSGRTLGRIAGGDEIDIAATAGVFECIAYFVGGQMGVQLADHAEFVGAELVQPAFFRVFGLAPVAGRLFDHDDARRSAIVSLGFARRNFGSAGAALGRSVSIESTPYEIVGVMPATMDYPANTDVWAAAPREPANRNRTGHNNHVVAKLASGVSVDAANASLSALGERLAHAFPDTNARKSFVAVPLRDNLVGSVAVTLFAIMGAVAVVLLIACANAASLMLARAASRQRGTAVRAALGASRRHLVGELAAESVLLAVGAGLLGFVVAQTGTEALLRAHASLVSLPRLHDVTIDWRVLVFTAAVSLATTIAFGLAPALQSLRTDVIDTLTRSGARGTVAAGSARMRTALVVAQIALSFALAIDAGLLFRSLLALTATPLGFRTENVLVAYAHAPAGGRASGRAALADYIRAGRFFEDLFVRLRAMPGVVSAAGAMGLPTGQYDSNGSYAVEGRQVFAGDVRRLPSAGFRLASPGYFATIGIPLLAGREFDEGDLYDRPFVAIVSESLARQTFGAEDPIGHRVMCGFDKPDAWMTVVGVVGDVRQASPSSLPGPELYMPLRQHPFVANEVQVVVRTSVPPDSIAGTVRETVHAMRPDVAMRFTTLEASVGDSIAAPRFRAALVSTFATLALLLAIAGMYAVTSYTSAQRTSEFALRLALGASTADLVRLVLGAAGRAMAIGIGLGFVLSAGTSRIIRTMLFGIGAADPATYAIVLVTAIPLVLIAAAVPALRASRVQPSDALRQL